MHVKKQEGVTGRQISLLQATIIEFFSPPSSQLPPAWDSPNAITACLLCCFCPHPAHKHSRSARAQLMHVTVTGLRVGGISRNRKSPSPSKAPFLLEDEEEEAQEG